MQLIGREKIISRLGEEDHFTGRVHIDDVIKIPPPTGMKVYRVFFEPGARTAWHAHPEGQVLYVVAGMGRVQKENEPVLEIGPGDTVYIAKGSPQNKVYFLGRRRGEIV